jgi:hypothetical protein
LVEKFSGGVSVWDIEKVRDAFQVTEYKLPGKLLNFLSNYNFILLLHCPKPTNINM